MVIKEYDREKLVRLVTKAIKFYKKNKGCEFRSMYWNQHLFWLYEQIGRQKIDFNVESGTDRLTCRNFVLGEYMQRMKSEPEDQKAEFREIFRNVMKLGQDEQM